MSCCPKSYWCTPGGLVGVDADANGNYTPPEDATGGPYATRAEGQADCPSFLDCSECETPFEFPSAAVGMYLSNYVGTPAGVDLPDYTELTGGTVAPGYFSFGWYSAPEFPVYTRLKVASYSGICASNGGTNVFVQATLAYTGGGWTWTPVAFGAGWTAYGPWGFFKNFPCGQQLDLSSPVYVGRIRYQNIGVDFTYDVYLGPSL